MSKTARTDGRRVVDYDINGVPIFEGQAIPLPRYDIPTLDEIKAGQGPLIDAIKSGWRIKAKEPSPNKRVRTATGA